MVMDLFGRTQRGADALPAPGRPRAADIIFLIDTSGSMSGEIEAVKQSCLDFADRITREEIDVRLGLVGFDIGGHRSSGEKYRVISLQRYTIGLWPLTTPRLFKDDVRALRVGLFGGSGCYLANNDTVDIFPHVVALFGDTPNVKVLVVVSDEIGNNAGLPAIVSLLKAAEIKCYVMGVPGSSSPHVALAKQMGGQFWDITQRSLQFSGLLGEVGEAIARDMGPVRRFHATRPRFAGNPDIAYNRNWSSTQPGCLILLVDQSRSMEDPFGGKQAGSGRRKADMVATVVNGLLDDLVTVNTSGTAIKARADVAVLGYEGGIVRCILAGASDTKPFLSLAELGLNPKRVETRKVMEAGDGGRAIETEVALPIWVDPFIGSTTPMCAALNRAAELAEAWSVAHPENYPPVIINVTDGASTDGDPTAIADELKKVSTHFGDVLLYNCHITHLALPTLEYPAREAEVPHDDEALAHLLFRISSIIPERARTASAGYTGRPLAEGARGFIFNGDAGSIRKMFVFASAVASGFAMNR